MGLSQGFYGFLLVVILIVVFTLIMVWTYRQIKSRQNEIEALSFQRWLEIDSLFVKSVCSLATYPYPERLDVEQAFRHVQPDMQLVIYNLVVKFGGEGGGQRYKFGVYLGTDSFPIIRVIPRLEEFERSTPARVGTYAVKNLLAYALKRSKETQLNFSDQPEFDQRFVVTTQNEERARNILTSDRLSRLARLPKGVLLQCSGGVISIDKPGVMVERRYFKQHLSQMTDLASQVGQIFLQ